MHHDRAAEETQNLITPSPADQGLSRRKFLQISSLGMLTVGVLSSCGGGGDDDDETPGTTTPPTTVVVTPSIFPQSLASGDPRPNSLVFWTRAMTVGKPNDNVAVKFELSTSSDMSSPVVKVDLQSKPEFDHVIKILIGNLTPATTYYYRFHTVVNSINQGTKIGRAKTAPTPDANVNPSFAFISCQDYIGRYYNTLTHLNSFDDLDFIVHLGDYIYETDGNDFQDTGTSRAVNFSEIASTIDLGNNNHAASSKSNYRDLYKTYRMDLALQELHEKFAFVSIWDDHEFSDDCWKNSATYRAGRQSEVDTTRKQNAERVWAEYMPTAYGLNANNELVLADTNLYPNTRIYRDLTYGKNLHLIMTDYRSFRPDHLIPEDAWPGTVVFDEQTLRAVFGAQQIPFEAVSANFYPYVNIDSPELAPYKQVLTGVLTQAYIGEGLSPEAAATLAAQKIQGNLATIAANTLIDAYNQSAPPQPLPRLSESGLPKGFPYLMLGKTGLFAPNGLGSRYFVVKSAYELYSSILYQMTQGASEDVFGPTQDAWLKETLRQSQATWKVVGNSTSMTSVIADLSKIPIIPAPLNQAFLVNVDQWDGFPNKRRELHQFIRDQHVSNVLFIAGDLHETIVGDHDGIFDFTVTSVSSGTFKQFIRNVTQGPPFAGVPGVGSLVENLELLFLDSSPLVRAGEPTRQMRYTRADVNGFAIMAINGNIADVTFYHIDENEVKTNQYGEANLASKFWTKKFRVMNGDLTELI